MNLKKGALLFLLLTCLAYTTLAQTEHILKYEDLVDENGMLTIDDDGMINACSYDFGANIVAGGTKLTIPKSVKPINGAESQTIIITGIGNNWPGIFKDKNLVSLEFADGSEVTIIGDYAFRYNPIVTLTLPTTLKTIGNFAFQPNEDVGDNKITELILPATLETIGNHAFQYNKIAKLTLPPLLTTIGNYTFQNNMIETLDLPASLTTIGVLAFESNNIKELSLPASLTTIGESAFYTNAITTLTFPDNAQLTIIGGNAFQGNDGEGNKIKTLTLPPSLSVIGDSAFYNNSLTTVTFNDDPNKSQIKNIEKDAFSGNTDELKGITLPKHAGGDDVKYKDSKDGEYSPEGRFTDFTISLVAVIPPHTLTADDVDLDEDDKGIITKCHCGNFVSNGIIIPEKIGDKTITGIGNSAFKEKNLATVTFAEGSKVISIGDSAFYNNIIVTLTFPENAQLTTIGSNAFYKNKIETLTFPENAQLTTIKNGAFHGNYSDEGEGNNIETLTLPASLATIGSNAFYRNSLTTVTFNDDPNKSQIKNIEKDAFSGNTDELKGITLPEHAGGTDVKYKDSKDGEYSPGDTFTDFTISLVAVIPPHILTADDVDLDEDGKGIITKCHCTFVSNRIIIPDKIGGITITEIGNRVFEEKSLVAVAFADGSQITSIRQGAFRNNSIETLSLPASMTTIDNEAFKTNKLTTVTFKVDLNKSQIKSIVKDAFSDNTELTGITLPEHAGGTDVKYKDSKDDEYSPGDTFTHFDRSLVAVIPPHTLTADDVDLDEDGKGIITKCHCTFVSNRIIIPDKIGGITITEIGNRVFEEKSLVAVAFADGSQITSIRQGAFRNNSIETLSLPASMTTIDNEAFKTNKLTTVTFKVDLNKSQIKSIVKDAFSDNTELTGITLPKHAGGDDVKYKDSDGNDYDPDDDNKNTFTHFDRSLVAVIPPHTLTADDVDLDEDGKGIITKCHCTFVSNSIIIPVQIGGITIKGIADKSWPDKGVFEEKYLASVAFADESQVTSIGSYAFRANLITTLSLPTTLATIGESAFQNNDITTLSLPTTLTTIGANAFSGNEKITGLTFPEDSQLTTIGNGAFFSNKITTLTLPTTLTTIGEYAFASNPLTSFTLPSVTIEGARTYWKSWQDGNSEDLIADLTILKADFGKSFELVSIQQVTLTTAVAEQQGGTITQSVEPNNDEGEYDIDTEVKLTAKPANGWRFDKWVITYGEDEDGNPITVTVVDVDVKVDANKTATAHFVQQVTLTLTIHGVGLVEGLKSGENPIDKGQELIINATPNEGHKFVKWVFEELDISTSTYKIPVEKTQGNLSIEVHFEKIIFHDPVELTINFTGQGTVTPIGTNTYERGSTVDLTANPQDDGWRFDKWVISDEQDKTDKTTTITLDADKTTTAHFVQLVTLTTSVEGQQGGTISANPNPYLDNQYDINTEVELTANPNEGWKFDKWVISDEENKTDKTTTITLDADKTATAHFVQLVTLTTSVEGQQGGTISATPKPSLEDNQYDINTEVELTATPNEGWKFDKWVISDEQDKTDEVTTITLDKNKSVTAHFVKEEAITSILTEVVSAAPYPNPVTSQITLKAKDGDLIQLFSPKGKQQYSTQHTGNEVHTIDVSAIPVGLYLVRITDSEGKTTTKRILKK